MDKEQDMNQLALSAINWSYISDPLEIPILMLEETRSTRQPLCELQDRLPRNKYILTRFHKPPANTAHNNPYIKVVLRDECVVEEDAAMISTSICGTDCQQLLEVHSVANRRVWMAITFLRARNSNHRLADWRYHTQEVATSMKYLRVFVERPCSASPLPLAAVQPFKKQKTSHTCDLHVEASSPMPSSSGVIETTVGDDVPPLEKVSLPCSSTTQSERQTQAFKKANSVTPRSKIFVDLKGLTFTRVKRVKDNTRVNLLCIVREVPLPPCFLVNGRVRRTMVALADQSCGPDEDFVVTVFQNSSRDVLSRPVCEADVIILCNVDIKVYREQLRGTHTLRGKGGYENLVLESSVIHSQTTEGEGGSDWTVGKHPLAVVYHREVTALREWWQQNQEDFLSMSLAKVPVPAVVFPYPSYTPASFVTLSECSSEGCYNIFCRVLETKSLSPCPMAYIRVEDGTTLPVTAATVNFENISRAIEESESQMTFEMGVLLSAQNFREQHSRRTVAVCLGPSLLSVLGCCKQGECILLRHVSVEKTANNSISFSLFKDNFSAIIFVNESHPQVATIKKRIEEAALDSTTKEDRDSWSASEPPAGPRGEVLDECSGQCTTGKENVLPCSVALEKDACSEDSSTLNSGVVPRAGTSSSLSVGSELPPSVSATASSTDVCDLSTITQRQLIDKTAPCAVPSPGSDDVNSRVIPEYGQGPTTLSWRELMSASTMGLHKLSFKTVYQLSAVVATLQPWAGICGQRHCRDAGSVCVHNLVNGVCSACGAVYTPPVLRWQHTPAMLRGQTLPCTACNTTSSNEVLGSCDRADSDTSPLPSPRVSTSSLTSSSNSPKKTLHGMGAVRYLLLGALHPSSPLPILGTTPPTCPSTSPAPSPSSGVERHSYSQASAGTSTETNSSGITTTVAARRRPFLTPYLDLATVLMSPPRDSDCAGNSLPARVRLEAAQKLLGFKDYSFQCCLSISSLDDGITNVATAADGNTSLADSQDWSEKAKLVKEARRRDKAGSELIRSVQAACSSDRVCVLHVQLISNASDLQPGLFRIEVVDVVE